MDSVNLITDFQEVEKQYTRRSPCTLHTLIEFCSMIKLDIISNMKTRKLPLFQSTELIQISAALHAVVCVCGGDTSIQFHHNKLVVHSGNHLHNEHTENYCTSEDTSHLLHPPPSLTSGDH